MMTQVQQRSYTIEEYRQLEETADFKSEYRNGEIVPMTGGTINHNRIAINICTFLKYALRGKNAEPFMSDLRLWIPRFRRGTYPDVMVIQGQPAFNEGRKDEVLNPVLIVEVVSKSTKDFDRENKFRFYRSIPEFREYILVNQYEFLVEQYIKNESGQWLFQEYEGEEATVTFASVEVQMSMKDIYEAVVFEVEETEEHQNQ
jgi:Uma2 family endonuclease